MKNKTSTIPRAKQQGFTLVVALILSLMTGTVVLTSLKDSVIQERMSGNFQKKMNAGLMAEKGIYTSVDRLEKLLEDNPNYNTLEQLTASIEEDSTLKGGGSIPGAKYEVLVSHDGNSSTAATKLFVQSDGERHKGESKLQAIFELVAGTGTVSNDFPLGITGCEEVSIKAGGAADSYDSRNGAYNIPLKTTPETFNKKSGVPIRTLNKSGGIEFFGAADIDGNVITPGSITFSGSANISGNVQSNGAITLPSDSIIGGDVSGYTTYEHAGGGVGGNIHTNGKITLSETPVGGNVQSRAGISITGKTISGFVLAHGDVVLKGATVSQGVSTQANYKQTGGKVDKGVRVQGSVTFAEWYNANIINNDLRYGQNPFTSKGGTEGFDKPPYLANPPPVVTDVTKVAELPHDDGILDANDPNDITCDEFNIKKQVEDLEKSIAQNAKDLLISGSGEGDVYELSKLNGDFTLNNGSSGSPTKKSTAQTGTFLGESETFLVFDNVTIKGHLKAVAGQHVTIYVLGNFKMEGASTLTIPDNSSLTLVAKGAVEIGAGGQVYTPDKGITASGKPVFSIFSSYSGTGIKLNGGTEAIYAAVYAPLTDVEISSSVGFKGAIHGNSVMVTGAGAIHYDEALGKSAGGGTSIGTKPKLVFKGWKYI